MELTDSGDLTVAVVRQRYGVFEGDDLQAPMGGDSLETHDLAGHEDDPAFTEDAYMAVALIDSNILIDYNVGQHPEIV